MLLFSYAFQKLTLADFVFAQYLSELKNQNPNALDMVPGLAHIMEVTLARPNIKKYIVMRPDTSF